MERKSTRGAGTRGSGPRGAPPALASTSRGVLLAALLLAPSPAARALDPSVPLRQMVVDSWHPEDGLPQNSSTSIVQGADGYVWMATEEGLARFDGLRFELFDQERVPGFGTNSVNVLCAGRDGSLWIGTAEALVRMQGGRFTSWDHARGLPAGPVWALAEDSAGTVWVGTDGGGVAQLREGRLVPFTSKEGLAGNSVRVLLAARDGSTWAGTTEGLTRRRGSDVKTYRVADGLPHPFVTSLWEARNGDLWIATNGGGLARLSGERIRVYGRGEGLPVDTVLCVREDRDGSLWAGTNGGGLCRLAGDRFECLASRDGLGGDLVFALGEDRERGLWFGTSGGGVGRLREGRFLTWGKKEGLRNDVALGVLEDKDGVIWVGTAGGGLGRIEGDRVRVYGAADGLPNAVVLSLARASGGGLWVGTAGGGLSRFDGRRFATISTRNGLASDLVQAILVAPDGSVWAGTNGGGINVLRDGKITAIRAREGLASDNVVSLLLSRDGSVWAATTGGLSHVVAGAVVRADAEALAGRTVLALHESEDGALWAGTLDRGLFRFAKGKVGSIRKKNGLLDDLVGAIAEDASGNLWMTCNKGVFRASRRELEAVAEGRARFVPCASYGTRDGMRTAECNGGFSPSSWRGADGRLWFPTGRGLSAIDPARLRDGTEPPPVRIEDVLVDGRAADPGLPVQVGAGSRNLEVRFTAPTFVDARSARFRYRLEGFDEAWVEAGTRRTAWYTNLPPGSYRFRVRACNSDGAWNEEGGSVPLTVAARFWQTGAFRLLCLGLALAAALGAVRLRERKARRREEEHARAQVLLEKAVAERTEQLKEANEALEAFAYSVSHDLRAPLRAIDGFSKILRTEHADRLDGEGRRLLGMVTGSAARMGRMVEALLGLSRVGRQELKAAPVDMTALARSAWEEATGTEPSSPVEFRLEELPPALGDELLLRQAWLNLLSNALKFTADRPRRTVRVRGRSEEGRNVYEVEDDGVGFDMAHAGKLFGVFQRLHSSSEFEGTGVGLSIVKRIVTRHGGEVSARSAVGEGATVAFTLPAPPSPAPGGAGEG